MSRRFLTAVLTVGLFTAPPLEAQEGGGFLQDAVVLTAASLGGTWAGAQVPFDPADDDSDFSVWHLLTAPVASAATVAMAGVLLGHDTGTSVKASLVGAGAGLAVGVVTSMVAGDTEVIISYAAVHGVVAALRSR